MYSVACDAFVNRGKVSNSPPTACSIAPQQSELHGQLLQIHVAVNYPLLKPEEVTLPFDASGLQQNFSFLHSAFPSYSPHLFPCSSRHFGEFLPIFPLLFSCVGVLSLPIFQYNFDERASLRDGCASLNLVDCLSSNFTRGRSLKI